MASQTTWGQQNSAHQPTHQASQTTPSQISDHRGSKIDDSPANHRKPQIPLHAGSRCAGCGSKVGSPILKRTLNRIRDRQREVIHNGILIGLEAPDDAAVIQVPTGQVLVQTVDYFRSLLNDPFLFGQISTNHCLNDIFAMAATPHSALAIATLPYGIDTSLEETLYQVLSGAVQVLQQAGAILIGGHTSEGAELEFGLSCNGVSDPNQLLRKAGMQPGEALILTKPIGTGTLFAADMQRRAKGYWIDGAIASMLQSNQAAATCFLKYGATACTDITGFGLIGHVLEMAQASQVTVELALDTIPILDGAIATIQQAILSSLHPQNLQAERYIINQSAISTHPLYSILFDPQTSGGLLATVPYPQAIACVESLHALGYTSSRIIGEVVSHQSDTSLIKISQGALSPLP